MLKFLYKIANKIFLGTGIRRLRIIKAIDNFIVHFIKSESAIINEYKMFLDPTDSLRISSSGKYEPKETKAIKKEIKEGDVVLDLGANIGYYTLLFAKLVGESGRVIAIEPDPGNFSLLKKNVEANNYKNIELFQAAATDYTGKITLYTDKDDPRQNSIIKARNATIPIMVDAIKIDDIVKQANFIKIDIEGGEERAIKGMDKLLRGNVKMMVEIKPQFREIISVLLNDFKLKRIRGENFLCKKK